MFTGAAALAFLTVVLASFGYALLDLILRLQEIPPGLVAAAGIFVWAMAWLMLRASLR